MMSSIIIEPVKCIQISVGNRLKFYDRPSVVPNQIMIND